jgi:hypothetical protein
MTEGEKKAEKTWQFWCVWEGYDTDELEFDDIDLKEGEHITYAEYLKRKQKRW